LALGFSLDADFLRIMAQTQKIIVKQRSYLTAAITCYALIKGPIGTLCGMPHAAWALTPICA
jgi:hypothetical protein